MNAKIIHQVAGGKLEHSEGIVSSEEGLKSCVIIDEQHKKIVCGPRVMVSGQVDGS